MTSRALQCIVPLAGPDFVRSDGTLKPLHAIDGAPLLLRALSSRAWYAEHVERSSDLVFVVRETQHTPGFITFLRDHFPRSCVVQISCMAQGALLSALAGAALLKRPEDPVCVDLVDILYRLQIDPLESFRDPACRGLLPYFESDDPLFSYLDLEGTQVRRTAEKRVISGFASAGTYFFRDLATLLEASAESLRRRDEWAVNGVLYLCPAFNALVHEGGYVSAARVTDVVPLSRMFHDP